ncbi:hypothetical protein [Leptolyngbya sp. AN02str]|uniref:hypothetical protein n=1 Tax=Leptolyngbya sp. AN02str TaxID=3423363 RepID=UPI003D31D552
MKESGSTRNFLQESRSISGSVGLMNQLLKSRKNRLKKDGGNSLYWGAFTILVGLLVIAFGLFLETIEVFSNLKLGSFLNTVGTTVFTMGFFQIILDLKSWRNYFEERVVSVFKKQDFLNDLSEDELMEIQINALRAYFQDDGIAREGSFFQYYKRHIQRLIEEPYREDVHFSLVVHDECSDSFTMTVSLFVSYVCRRGSNGCIQPNILWSTHRKEISELEYFEIQLQHFEDKSLPRLPALNFHKISWYEEFSSKLGEADGSSKKCEKCPQGCSLSKVFLNKPEAEIVHLCNNQNENNEEIGFCYPLSEKYKRLDRLHVTIQAKYTVPIADLRIFKMHFLSKNVTFSIHYPDKFELDFYSFGIFKDLLMISQEESYSRYYYDSWMLPDSGIVWRLKSKQSLAAEY